MINKKIKIGEELFSLHELKDILKMSDLDIRILSNADGHGLVKKDFTDKLRLSIELSKKCLKEGLDPDNKPNF